MITYLKDENLDDLTKDKKVLIDFYADWCMPCNMLGESIEEIVDEDKNVNVVKINVDEHPDLAKQVLHNDWNKTNLALATVYPDLTSIIKTMPEKVQTVVEFKNGTPTYISLDSLFSFIEEMRKKIVLTDLISF